ncbi:MAG: bifunctional oligoribonuclease/PAP phosphatase NrnA [Deltaproteobacteria bacterium]|nr:bifunctional oligoribonuclease/PAP phosphatase NrnA [Deltaproteobacteria bacterium]
MDKRFDRIVEVIKGGKRFLVTSHVNPEGDAVGSVLALALGIRGLEKEVAVFLQDEVPAIFRFLPGADDVASRIDGVFDATFVVDCGQIDRLGEGFKREGKGVIINIDHHSTNDSFGDINIVEPEASATGEIIYVLLKTIPVEITLDIATDIYVAILTDTGSFRYSSATPRAFKIAGGLVEKGVDPWKVAQRVYESYPARRFKLLGMVLETLEITMDGKVASLVVTRDMLDKAEADKELTDGFVNYARAIGKVEVGLLFRESGNGMYKVSMRARGNVDVSQIAQGFGGGGHPHAAGCEIRGSLKEVKERVLGAVERAVVPNHRDSQ